MFAFPWGQPGTPLEHFKGPRKWQREVLQQIATHIQENKGKVDFNTLRHAVSSGRGIGKSALVSWITIWMLTTRIGSTTIISANSESQLRSVTWAEITKWLATAINSHWFEVSATRLMPAKWLTELVERDLKKGTRYWGVEGGCGQRRIPTPTRVSTTSTVCWWCSTRRLVLTTASGR
jgi:hypothetical protein